MTTRLYAANRDEQKNPGRDTWMCMKCCAIPRPTGLHQSLLLIFPKRLREYEAYSHCPCCCCCCYCCCCCCNTPWSDRELDPEPLPIACIGKLKLEKKKNIEKISFLPVVFYFVLFCFVNWFTGWVCTCDGVLWSRSSTP